MTLLFLASSNRFTPQILLSLVPNLGCVIDLTATDRYYRPTVCYCFVCFTSQVVALLFLFYSFLFSYHKLFGASIPFLTLLLFFFSNRNSQSRASATRRSFALVTSFPTNAPSIGICIVFVYSFLFSSPFWLSSSCLVGCHLKPRHTTPNRSFNGYGCGWWDVFNALSKNVPGHAITILGRQLLLFLFVVFFRFSCRDGRTIWHRFFFGRLFPFLEPTRKRKRVGPARRGATGRTRKASITICYDPTRR